MTSAFGRYHPAVNFSFFLLVIILSVVFIHPAYIAVSALCAAVYCVLLKGADGIKTVAICAPLFIVVSAINPVFNTLGSTVLFTYFGRPYTLEALVYGFAIGGMIVSVILWFSCYGVIMTSDKFTSLFAPIIPAVSLLLVMVLRLVPSYWRKAKQVSAARKCIGKVGADSAKGKIAEGASVLSALSMWALEGSVMTADSMRARGYGTARRSSFQLYRFRVNDAVFAIIMLTAAITVIVGASGGCTAVSFVPDITLAEADGFLAVYAILMLMPSIIEIRELLIWNYSISKI